MEDSAGRIGPGDREFIIQPTFGAAVKTALNPGIISDAVSRTVCKKPFDWMGDEQFANLQVLYNGSQRFKFPLAVKVYDFI